MADAESTGLPLEATAGVADRDATEAFALLADETRLAILLALWDAYDPHGGDDTLQFSEIHDRVDYDDPGNLSYHLEKLQGQFVRRCEDGEGYTLRTPGLKLVQTVIGGAGVKNVNREPAEIDQPCRFCGASTTIRYREGLVVHACTECAGAAPDAVDVDGFLAATPFDPAGLAGRDAEELRAAAMVSTLRETRSLFEGLCPACSGPVDGWLDVCPDHDNAGACDACGARQPAHVRFECRVCKNFSVSPLQGLALHHPAVVSFYDDHGVSTRVHADEFETVRHLYGRMDDHRLEVNDVDPPRATVVVALDGDEMHVTFDETARVVDVTR